MKPTQLLHNLGQSLWLDNITRDLLNSGTLKRYIDELSVTGLTSNPTIWRRERLARVCFSIWHWTISPRPPICFAPFTTARTVWTVGYLWRCRRCWRMT